MPAPRSEHARMDSLHRGCCLSRCRRPRSGGNPRSPRTRAPPNSGRAFRPCTRRPSRPRVFGTVSTNVTRSARSGTCGSLLKTSAVALTDRASTLAWDGVGRDEHAARAVDLASSVLQPAARPPYCTDTPSAAVTPRARSAAQLWRPSSIATPSSARSWPTVRRPRPRWCGRSRRSRPGCRLRSSLAGADRRQAQLVRAELSALRAQISPHFIYNSLTAIASFVRTDPDRARELLLEFADFSRYALRRGSAFTTLADELRNTERYLVLEQARFGERLVLSLRVAPEVLAVSVPYLVVQPLVENAVRHGLAPSPASGRSRSPRSISAPRPRSRSRTTGWAPIPRRSGGRSRASSSESGGRFDRAVERRCASTPGLWRRLWAGRRDRAQLGDEGELSGAQVRAREPSKISRREACAFASLER